MQMCSLLGTLSLAFAVHSPVAAGNEVPAAATDAFIRELSQLINDYRARHGLQPLTFAENLAALANDHSVDMAARRKLSHDGFRNRAQSTRSKVCVENVGWNYPTAATQLDGWRHSPTHDRNLLEPKVSRMGLAVTTRYVAFFACT